MRKIRENQKVVWTVALEDLIRQMWNVEKKSAAQIAAEIPGATRNAIVGKLNRIQGIERRTASGKNRKPQGKPRGHHTPTPRNLKPISERLYRGTKTVPKVEDFDIGFPPLHNKPMRELDDGQCRWPTYMDKELGQMCCAGPVLGRASYCASHSRASERKSEGPIDRKPYRPVVSKYSL